MAADDEPEEDEAMDEALDALLAPPMPSSAGERPPERSRGSKPLPPRADTERTLGLEVGRLFGLNPRMLVEPDAGPPEPRPRPRPRPSGSEPSTAPGDGGEDTTGS